MFLEKNMDISGIDLLFYDQSYFIPDEISTGGDEEDKSHCVGEKTRGKKKDSSDKDQHPADQLPGRHYSPGKIVLNVPQNIEPLLPHHISTQNPRDDNNKNSIGGSNS